MNDTQQIIQTLDLTSNKQISPILLQSLSKNPFTKTSKSEILSKGQLIEFNYDRITEYDKAVQVTLAIGWAEHTSDWDPFYKITLTDGTEILTESGYSSIYDINPSANTIQFDNCNEDGDEELLTLELSKIQSLQILES